MELGGASNQSGILYQNSIAALYLGRLCDRTPRLDEHFVVAVRVEPPEAVDDIVVTFRDGHRTFIQAKENIRVNDSAWQQLWRDFENQFWGGNFQQGTDRLLLHVGEVREELHVLREIGIRASTSPNHKEWLARLNQAQLGLLKRVSHLFDSPHATEEGILFLFKHFDLEIRSLVDIERDSIISWVPNSNKPQKELFRLLRDRVGGAARKRGSFDLDSLLSSLTSESNVRFVAQPSLDELRQTVRDCGAGLKQHKRSFGDTRVHLKRTIVESLTGWALQASDDGQDNVGILLDRAGMGKTVILQDVLHTLESAGAVVLAIKADQLSGITSADELQEKLGLTDSVEKVLARFAQESPTVLLIDQIDALSLSLARDQSALDVVMDLVARARIIPGVRVLMSCRTFDLNNTPSIRDIESRKFELKPLTTEEISEVFAALRLPGTYFDRLSPATRELLRVPLHLDLFMRALSELASTGTDIARLPHQIRSLQDLYAIIWQQVVCKNDPSAPSVANREMVLKMVTNEVNRKQSMTIPQSLFVDQAVEIGYAAEWLASQGILVPDDLIQLNRGWTLLHQTFFDYCYAKDFVDQGKSLFQIILNSDQGLFSRSQIVHVLEYLRGTDQRTYISELSKLVNSSHTDVRFHLRDLVFRWFGSLYDPTDNEWIIAQRILVERNKRPLFLAAAQGNSGWFRRLKETLENSLKFDGDEILDKETIPFLCSIVNIEQTEVVGMLRPFRKKSEKWDQRIRKLIQSVGVWSTDEAITLFEEVFRDAAIDNIASFYEVHELAKSHPRVGCKLIRIALDRIVDEYVSTQGAAERVWRYDLSRPLEVFNGTAISDALDKIPKVEPKYFLEIMLPWLERVVCLKDSRGKDSFSFTGDGLSDSWYSSPYVVLHEINEAFISALTTLARTAPTDFRELAKRVEVLTYATPQRYMAHVYRNVASSYCEDAVNFLTSDLRRLDLGDHHQYDTRQLIKVLIPHLQPEQTSKLEALILIYEPIKRYRGVSALTWRGLEKLYLLQCFPEELLSDDGLKALRQLERKFPDMRASENPRTSGGGLVGPPIPDEIARKMSDKAWLSAMQKYKGNVEHRDFLKGGAAQQGAVLSRRVKEEPERFYRLAMRVPLETDQFYVRAFITGLGESAAPPARTFDVMRRFAPVADSETKRAISWVLQKRTEEIPADIVELMEGYLRGPEAEDESWWLREEEANRKQGRNADNHGGAYSSYLNSVRGSAMMALMRALDHSNIRERCSRKWEIVESITSDSSTALRAGALEELLSLLDLDRERALSLFDRIMEGHPDLLRSYYTDDLVYWGFFKNYLRMHPYILAMMDDENETIQQRGAELACIAAISQGAMESEEANVAAQSLAHQTLTGSATWRRGAARVYAQNLSNNPTTCADALTILLNDDDEEVRRFVSGIYPAMSAEHIVSLRAFINDYARSRSLQTGINDFAEFLWKNGPIDPEWALSVVDAILKNPHMEQSEIRFAGGEELIRLVLRVYTDPTVDKAIRENAMDLFDHLMEKSSWAAQKVLAEWDRR